MDLLGRLPRLSAQDHPQAWPGWNPGRGCHPAPGRML